MNPEHTIVAASILGFLLQELFRVRKGIRLDPTSPDAFSFIYYFTRPANITQLAINAVACGLLMLGRHEVVGMLNDAPVIGGHLNDATPILVGGSIGFGGGWFVDKVMEKMGGDSGKKE